MVVRSLENCHGVTPYRVRFPNSPPYMGNLNLVGQEVASKTTSKEFDSSLMCHRLIAQRIEQWTSNPFIWV